MTVLRILCCLAQIAQVAEHVGQGVEIALVLDLGRDDVGSGDAGDGAADIREDEVVDRPFPPAHAGADGFLLDVLAESCTLLSELGVEGSGDIPHGVPCGLIAFEESFFGVAAHEAAKPAVHALFFSAALVGAEGGISLLDKQAVDVSRPGFGRTSERVDPGDIK